MKKKRLRMAWLFCAAVVLAVLSLVAPATVGAADMCGGIDGFVLLADQSGSTNKGFDQEMSLLAKVVQSIPAKSYQAALRSFYLYSFGDGVKSRLEWGAKPFDQAGMLAAVKALTNHRAKTPLGPAMAASAAELGKMPGKKALVIFSDFRWSDGFGDPVAEAKALTAKYPGLCIYTLCFDLKGAKMAQQIADAAGCGKYYDASALLAQQASFDDMIKTVFVGESSDSDGDGVCDGMDKCPGTPAGLKVDQKGCPLPVKMTLQIEFDTAKADIRPEYDTKISAVADFLKKYPNTTAVIEGHTDARGSDMSNLKLSQARAESLQAYMTEKFGIDASRLTAKGFGESKPVADNKTKEGMQKNRRVVVVITGSFEKK